MGIESFLATALITAGLPSVVATATAQITIGLGLSLASSAIAGTPRAPKPPDGQAVLNQAAAPRIRGYGRCLLGGTRAFWDSRDGILYQVIMMHSGRVSEFVRFRVGDKWVETDDFGRVTNDPFWRGDDESFVILRSRPGNNSPNSYTGMKAAWPEIWTDDHLLRGIATVYAAFDSPGAKKFQKVFPQSHSTQIQAEADLTPVFDPRTSATGFSDNASLCIRDYLLSSDGYRLTRSEVDDAAFGEFAGVCDGQGYRLCGTYSLLDDPKAVLARMLATCDGELYDTAEGKVGIRGGEWTEPTATITARDIISYDLEQGADRFATFNEMKIVYTGGAGQGYQPTEAKPFRVPADQAERGILSTDFTVDMVPSGSQARRLAKIHYHKENPDWRGTITTNAYGLVARGERMIRLDIPELGINMPFRVLDHGITLTDGVPTNCVIEVSSLTSVAYGIDPAEPDDTAPDPEDTSPDGDLPVPDFSLAQSGGKVRATAVDPGTERFSFEAEIEVSGEWVEMSVADGALVAVSDVLASGTYDVRARWVTANDVAGEWAEDSITF